VARQQSSTSSSSGIESPGMTNLDRAAFVVTVIGENELWCGLEVVRGIDVFWTWSECCQLNRVVGDIPQMSVRKVMIPDMFRTSDILSAFLTKSKSGTVKLDGMGGEKERRRRAEMWELKKIYCGQPPRLHVQTAHRDLPWPQLQPSH
jgi:hypothetical protein